MHVCAGVVGVEHGADSQRVPEIVLVPTFS
jgi:hypothetical protein